MDESQSPFKDSRSQQIFKNVANLSLKGHTYDARHLDKFLDSEFCEKSKSPARAAYSKSTLEK